MVQIIVHALGTQNINGRLQNERDVFCAEVSLSSYAQEGDKQSLQCRHTHFPRSKISKLKFQ